MFIAEFHHKREVAHLHQVAALERRLARHALPIEERAVAAPEVAQRDAARLRAEQAMVAAHAGRAQPKVTVRAPANQELRLAKEDLARLLRRTTRFDETGFHGILENRHRRSPQAPVSWLRRFRALLTRYQSLAQGGLTPSDIGEDCFHVKIELRSEFLARSADF
jgi:hypothetical protein